MTDTKSGVPAIYGAMAKVMRGVANIPKNGQMSFGKTDYAYLRADDVQEKLNPLLTENGIVVLSEYSVETLMRGRAEGAPYVYVNLELTYYSVEDGSSFGPVRAVGEAAATDDKSINKALTQAIKNAHRATFQFASGEAEPDDQKPRADAEPGPTQAQQKINAARPNSTPAAAPQADDPVRALQKEIQAADKARKESDPDFIGYRAHGSALLGKTDWVKDEESLRKVLESIKSGEVVGA